MTLASINSFLDWAWPYVASSLTGFLGLLAVLQTPFGSKIFDFTFKHYFDRKISSIKHEQDKRLSDIKYHYDRDIENLRASLSYLSDRGKHSNEKEYQALILCWESFVAAYFSTLASVARFTRHPDLNRMDESDLDEFIASDPILVQNK